MSKTTISMFATQNDTDQWAVTVDGLFGLFTTETKAQDAYNATGGHDGSDGLADTPFGSSQLLAPGYTPYDWRGDDMTETRLSERRAIDICDYIRKTRDRALLRVSLPMPTRPAWQRLADRRAWASLYDGLEG